MACKALRIYQLSDGYCYNTDSLILAHFAKPFLKKSMRILDVGAGSGILGILCAREIVENLQGSVDLHLVEKDPLMCFLANKNAFRFQGQVYCEDFLAFRDVSKFDLIISNPPFYTRGVRQKDNPRKNMAKNRSFLPLDAMLSHIKRLIQPNGVLCMCYDARNSGELFYECQQKGLRIESVRFVYPLPDRDATLVLLKARIQTRSQMQVLPPLFTHQSPKQMDNTEELKAIYEWAKTASIKVDSQWLHTQN
ncbi:methyltransferase domain-containing protein [Helicobacter sp. MIT 05-5293]|uniref:tRNA1(Val) (adenine(37)-N6)-methyltransferase n=1 Tax=Helicobacter sp. MIT 05-5293 TaxID=1548149 RepID=UPI0010FCFC49|nr:methyltransferase [Helicobacter sp. MIT 05-5293]TLD81655.1 methyltransferase domain-containing protein [Helicobacter sp. MIT 05-5293]